MPVSLTQHSTQVPCSMLITSTRTLPRCVNLMALPTRLRKICLRRVASPRNHCGTSGATLFLSTQFLLLRLPAHQLVDLVHDLADVHRSRVQRDFARLELGQIEYVVDQCEQNLTAAADRLRIRTLLFGELGHQQQLRHAQHAVHRRADLVAHHRQEFAFGAQRFVHHGERLLKRARALVHEALELRGMGLQALIGLVQLHALVLEQLFGLLARATLALYAAQDDFHFVGEGPVARGLFGALIAGPV